MNYQYTGAQKSARNSRFITNIVKIINWKKAIYRVLVHDYRFDFSRLIANFKRFRGRGDLSSYFFRSVCCSRVKKQ
jgi:hypothetical protein